MKLSESRILGTTQVYGIIGDPISHTLSPPLHNSAFAALKMDAVYLPFHVDSERVGEALQGLLALNVRGINVTVPHKSAVLPWVAEVTETAGRIGAVNTLRNEGGRWIGENTDAAGFLKSLEPLQLKLAGSSVGMLGAGGAARGIAVALLEAGVDRLFICNRNSERAQELVRELQPLFAERELRALPLVELERQPLLLLVNTTTVGSDSQSQPVDLKRFHQLEAVNDIIYRPTQTPLLHQAELLGLPSVNGGGMLLHQGTAAFRFWTGQAAPEEAMRQTLIHHLGAL